MSQQATQTAQPTVSDLVDHLTRFDGPPDEFLLHLLAVQCHVGSADGGAILRTRGKQEPEVLAVFPAPEQGQATPVWLAQTVEAAPRVVRSTETVVAPIQSAGDFYDQTPRHHLVMIPLRSAEGVRGVEVFILERPPGALLDQSRQRLELTVSLLSLYEMRLTLQRRHQDLQRMREALEVLASINNNRRFKAATMALCNEIAAAWKAERVSLGFLKGRYVKAVGMSHTEKFTRKMKLVLDIESAMEECFDQDVEVVHPPSAEATYVSRAAGSLSHKHGPTTVCSVPLRQEQKTIGVLTVERAPDQPFDLEQIESLRLVCELCTARLDDLHEHDKWFGAKAMDKSKKGLTVLLGTEHTWVKALAVGLFLLAVVLFGFSGTDYAKGPFTVQTVDQRVVPAPFGGILAKVLVEEADPVIANETVLAIMDTQLLNSELRSQQAELNQWNTQRRHAMRAEAHNSYEQRLAETNIERIKAEIFGIRQHLKQSNIVATVSGIVIAGDLKRMEGSRVEQGDSLFEIGPVDMLRAEILIPENRVSELGVDKDGKPQRGELQTRDMPGTYIPFIVESVAPRIDTRDQQSVVRVRVLFDSEKAGIDVDQLSKDLKIGTEGVARIEVGRAKYGWLWTRDLINWIRMKLWW